MRLRVCKTSAGEMLSCMRAGILVCVVVTVLMVVVGVVCLGTRSLSVVELDYLGVLFMIKFPSLS